MTKPKTPPKVEARAGLTKDGRPWVKIRGSLPPSDNHLYFVQGHRKILTKEGRVYKQAVKNALGKLAFSMPSFNKDLWHEARISVFYERVEAAGWHERYKRGAKAGQRKAKRRFFKNDTDNRKKLIIDSVCECIDIDDTCLSPKVDQKDADPENPRIEITIVQRAGQEIT